MELHPLGARRFLHVSDHAVGTSSVGRVHKQRKLTGLGNQFGKQFEALGQQLDADDADAREVAARPGEGGDKTGPDRVAYEEDDWDNRGGTLCRTRRNGALSRNYVDLATGEFGG